MRYLRMLSNSAFAGVLAAVYLTVLVLSLNPSVPLAGDAVAPIFAVMALTYGAHIAVVSYVLYVIRQIALAEPSSPGWISLRLMSWSAAALSGTAAVVTWLHASGLQNTLDPAALPLLARAVVVFTAAAIAFFFLAIAQGVAIEHRRSGVGILFTVATVASMVIPFVARGPAIAQAGGAVGSPASAGSGAVIGPRVLMLCLDGASLEFISPAVASGRLPNFGRILERGASMHLATARPTQVDPSWASIVTGKWPSRHAVRGNARYQTYLGGPMLDVLPDYLYSQGLIRFGFFSNEPHTSESLRAQPLWRLLGTQGISSGLIGLPLTYPIGNHRGFVISDRFDRGRQDAALAPAPVVVPAEVDELVHAVMAGEDGGDDALAGIEAGLLLDAGARALAADSLHHRLARRLLAVQNVRLLATRYVGLDVIGHAYLRFAQSDSVGNVSDDERRRYGRVLDEYYGFVDEILGELLSSMRNDDLLFVVSAFGMEPLDVQKRMLERVAGDPRFGATHETAPDGFALAYGDAVVPGRLTRGTIVDVTPTLLYFLGLSIGRDMDGFARTDMFTSAFNTVRTISFIPTYER